MEKNTLYKIGPIHFLAQINRMRDFFVFHFSANTY